MYCTTVDIFWEANLLLEDSHCCNEFYDSRLNFMEHIYQSIVYVCLVEDLLMNQLYLQCQ
jgi:hypothetical protein